MGLWLSRIININFKNLTLLPIPLKNSESDRSLLALGVRKSCDKLLEPNKIFHKSCDSHMAIMLRTLEQFHYDDGSVSTGDTGLGEFGIILLLT